MIAAGMTTALVVQHQTNDKLTAANGTLMEQSGATSIGCRRAFKPIGTRARPKYPRRQPVSGFDAAAGRGWQIAGGESAVEDSGAGGRRIPGSSRRPPMAIHPRSSRSR